MPAVPPLAVAVAMVRMVMTIRAEKTVVKRLMVPFGLDEDIDLPWIHSLCLESERNDMALVVCLHTPESIVYETIHSELP